MHNHILYPAYILQNKYYSLYSHNKIKINFLNIINISDFHLLPERSWQIPLKKLKLYILTLFIKSLLFSLLNFYSFSDIKISRNKT